MLFLIGGSTRTRGSAHRRSRWIVGVEGSVDFQDVRMSQFSAIFVVMQSGFQLHFVRLTSIDGRFRQRRFLSHEHRNLPSAVGTLRRFSFVQRPSIVVVGCTHLLIDRERQRRRRISHYTKSINQSINFNESNRIEFFESMNISILANYTTSTVFKSKLPLLRIPYIIICLCVVCVCVCVTVVALLFWS